MWRGRYNNSVWENEDGIPLFRYAWVTGKDHVNLPAENQLLWDGVVQPDHPGH